MTKKFKEIIKRLEALAKFKADMSMTDDDFILNIETINLLINVHDDLGLDSKGLRKRMAKLYPEFPRRIYGKNNIQLALPLIKALNDFIYGRGDDRGSQRWRDTLVEMCCKVVYAYRKEALIFSTDYLFALDIVSCKNDDDDTPNIKEYKKIASTYLLDIDNVSLSEKIRQVGAYERAKHLFISENWEKWVEVCEQLKMVNIRSLDDKTFLLWCEVTDQYPKNELKKRSGTSKQTMLEYLRAQVISEFAKQDRLRTQRKLAKGLKTLNDNIIGDIIPLKIDFGMSVSTRYALETVFYLRLALAQISDEDNNSTYELLCRDRFEMIANALEKKYPKAATLNEKIEILEHLTIIGGEIHSLHEDFAIEEADKLKDLPDLTYAQKLRLDWSPSITSGNESEIVAKLLLEANTSFEIATLALITDYISDSEREAILNRYFDLFNTVLSINNTTELGKLLVLSVYWNSTPSLRTRIKKQMAQILIPRTSSLIELPLPERQVNAIASEIYAQIDKETGKYIDCDNIPA